MERVMPLKVDFFALPPKDTSHPKIYKIKNKTNTGDKMKS